jgi:hypothetical protein
VLFLDGERERQGSRRKICSSVLRRSIRVRSEEDRVRRPLPRPAPTEAQDSFFALPAPQGRHFGCCVRLGRPDQPRRSPSCAEPIARPDPQRRMHAADNRPRGAGRDTQTSGTPTYPNSGCQRIYRKPVSWLKKGFLAVAKGPHHYNGEPFLSRNHRTKARPNVFVLDTQSGDSNDIPQRTGSACRHVLA